jgi:hypothetical protein
VAYLVDWRTGFPFSVHDEAGHVSGEPNSFRFPNYFELNLHIERLAPLEPMVGLPSRC